EADPGLALAVEGQEVGIVHAEGRVGHLRLGWHGYTTDADLDLSLLAKEDGPPFAIRHGDWWASIPLRIDRLIPPVQRDQAVDRLLQVFAVVDADEQPAEATDAGEDVRPFAVRPDLAVLATTGRGRVEGLTRERATRRVKLVPVRLERAL